MTGFDGVAGSGVASGAHDAVPVLLHFLPPLRVHDSWVFLGDLYMRESPNLD